VSDLAEYAFCPRALWYRTHPPAEGRSARATRSAARGTRFHARALNAEVRRDRRLGWYVGGIVGAALCMVGGIAWLWLR
jgi:CRISPR/Cas system-associated exonuclease Cas4 (RecB family)